MELNSTIKKLIVLNAIFGGKTSKLTGVRDSGNRASDTVKFNTLDNSIQFTNNVPEFLVADQFFRITSGGGSDKGKLLKVKNVSGKKLFLTDDFGQLVNDYLGSATFDARIFVQINDPQIAKEASDGSTQFNVNLTNRADSAEIGPSIASNFVEHYHDQACVSEYRIEVFKEDLPEYNQVIDDSSVLMSSGLGYIEIPGIETLPIVEVWKYEYLEDVPFLLGMYMLGTMELGASLGKKKSYIIHPTISIEDGILRVDFGEPIDGQVILKGANNAKC